MTTTRMSFGAARHTVTSHALTSFHFLLHLVATTHTSYQHRPAQDGEEKQDVQRLAI
jgi:hypothetical protein